MTVITNPTRVDHAVIIVHQFLLYANIPVTYILSFLEKKEFASLNPRARTLCYTEIFHVPVHTTTVAVLCASLYYITLAVAYATPP